MERVKQFDHDYYIRLKKIDVNKADEYRDSFLPKIIKKPEVDKIELVDEQTNEVMQIEKKPEIMLGIKEVKQLLKEKGVKNRKFLSPEEAMLKAKQIGL